MVVWFLGGLLASNVVWGTPGTPAQTPQPKSSGMAASDYMVMGEYINPQDSLPHLRYFDGDQASLNDRCAVRKVKLNPKMPPIYVNGQPIGFC